MPRIKKYVLEELAAQFIIHSTDAKRTKGDQKKEHIQKAFEFKNQMIELVGVSDTTKAIAQAEETYKMFGG